MKPTPKPKKRAKDSLPTKPLLEELARLRTSCREIVERYRSDVEGEIAVLVEAVKSQTTATKVPQERVHDLRDMLMLLRGLELKPAKGRRRDLKRIENVLEELTRTAERW